MTPTAIAASAAPMLLAYDKMPSPVTDKIALIGGWFVFLVDFLAAVHITYLGAAIAVQYFSDHRRMPIPSGEWFTKIMAGVWICAAAGTIAAVIIGVT